MPGCYLCNDPGPPSDRLVRCMGVENVRGIETDLEVYNGLDWTDSEHRQEAESYLHLGTGPEAQKARHERMSCPHVPGGQRQFHCSCVHGDPRRAFSQKIIVSDKNGKLELSRTAAGAHMCRECYTTWTGSAPQLPSGLVIDRSA